MAAEWQAQDKVIDPGKMPVTRLVNTALDGRDREAMLCRRPLALCGHRHAVLPRRRPEELVARQTARWEPVTDWLAHTFGARLVLAEGVIHQEQPAAAIAAIGKAFALFHDPVRLACLHTITTLTGSAVLALAFAHGRLSADDVWQLAHLDEDWNIELWGTDAEAEARRRSRLVEFEAATATFKAAGQKS